jgi:hypothetical protein
LQGQTSRAGRVLYQSPITNHQSHTGFPGVPLEHARSDATPTVSRPGCGGWADGFRAALPVCLLLPIDLPCFTSKGSETKQRISFNHTRFRASFLHAQSLPLFHCKLMAAHFVPPSRLFKAYAWPDHLRSYPSTGTRGQGAPKTMSAHFVPARILRPQMSGARNCSHLGFLTEDKNLELKVAHGHNQGIVVQ